MWSEDDAIDVWIPTKRASQVDGWAATGTSQISPTTV